MQRDFVTPGQIEKARKVNLLDYVQRTEPGNVVPSAPGEFMLKDHDSLKFSKGKFHWHSRGIGGINAIDYLVKVRGMEFKEAVRELAGVDFTITSTISKHAPPEKPKSKNDGRFFILPKANSHNNDVIDYLKGRGIEENIIMDCIRKGLVYQGMKKNCVFVGFDEKQNPKFACERGIGSSDFKKDVAGSNKAFNFCMQPRDNESNTVYVFEGVVDCLSHASISQIGSANWDGYRLSLGGVSSAALKTFLENNPQITNVYLALDNDKPGKDATARIIKEVMDSDTYDCINLFLAPPPVGNDYNDTLKFMREKIRERKLQAEKDMSIASPRTQTTKKRSETVL